MLFGGMVYEIEDGSSSWDIQFKWNIHSLLDAAGLINPKL